MLPLFNRQQHSYAFQVSYCLHPANAGKTIAMPLANELINADVRIRRDQHPAEKVIFALPVT